MTSGGLVSVGCTPAALHNLHRGCDQGSASQCVKLGTAYYEGKDDQGKLLDLDYFKARKAFERACDRESGSGCSSLGSMFENGEGGSVDKGRALGLYQRGCELGDGTACLKTALGFRDGLGQRPDLVRATTAARKGCDRESEKSCKLYKELQGLPGSGGAPELTAEASALVSSCEQGSSDGCFEAGLRFDGGTGAPKDKPRAAGLYQKACERDDQRGCHNLGIMLLEAEGIPRDVGKGLRLIDQACAKNQRKSCEILVARVSRACNDSDADACTVLGRFYIKGERSLETNITRGVELLRRGCKLGDKDGCDDLRKLGLEPGGN